MRRLLGLLVAVAALLGGCSDKSSNTKIMVVVWSNLTVPADMDKYPNQGQEAAEVAAGRLSAHDRQRER